MKKILKYILILLLLLLIGFYMFMNGIGSGLPSYVKYIPPKATKVVSIDSKNCLGKVDLVNLIDMSFYKMIKEILAKEGISTNNEGPQELGFSLFQPYYFFSQDGDSSEMKFHSTIIPLDDHDKFGTFMKKRYADMVKTFNDFKYVQTMPKTVIAWNEEVMFLISGTTKGVDALKQMSKQSFSNSLAGQNSSFKNFQDNEFEIGMWADFEVFFEQHSSKAMLLTQMGVTSQLFKGSYLTSSMYFEEGYVDVDMDFHFNQNIENALNGFFVENSNQNLMKYMMLEDLPVLGRFSIDMQLGNKLLKKNEGKYGMIGNIVVAQKIPEMFNGDFAMSLNRVTMKDRKEWRFELDAYDTIREPNYEFLAAVGIDDVEGMREKLSNPLIKREEGFYNVMDEVYMAMREDKLYVTTSPTIMEEFIALKANEIPSVKNEKMLFHTEVDNLISKFSPEAIKYLGIKHTDIIQNNIDYMDFRIRGLKGDAYQASLKIQLKNTKENSLYTILGMYNESIEVPSFGNTYEKIQNALPTE